MFSFRCFEKVKFSEKGWRCIFSSESHRAVSPLGVKMPTPLPSSGSGWPPQGEPGEDDRGEEPARGGGEPGEGAEQAHAAADEGHEGGDGRAVQEGGRGQPQEARAGECFQRGARGSGLDWLASCSANCEPLPLHQEMDIESLEAANQSLQVDLKLAFKRIGDLQAAIEDEMESDDNDDLINRYAGVFLPFLFFFLQSPFVLLCQTCSSKFTHSF